MPTVKFNAEAARAAIRKAIGTLSDMTPLYQDIGEYMVEATRRRFIEGRAPDGSAWAPKSQTTLDRYRRMGYGSLLRPLIGPGKALSRQILQFVNRDGVTIGSPLIYSGTMQNGAAKGAFGADRRGRPIPWGRIPARVWLGIAARDELAIVEIVDEHLIQDINTSD
ncbi:MAG: phage virion morphogenesis protein [Novosphingobium sp.]|uniref:phage virion morphogenesis protein n=1 Tax=Novosphingobium sp. TaxID=1874826 RepID=UPI0032BB4EE9